MYQVYILKSKDKRWFYVGMSSNMQARLRSHNSGIVRSTKAYKPFKIIYTESFSNRKDARDKEKFYKIRYNKEKLLCRLGYR